MFTLHQYYLRYLEEQSIPKEWYQMYHVKNGLRNEDGTGVLVGLTKVADVVGYEMKGTMKKDAQGKLYYRGYEIQELLEKEDTCNQYERCGFLLLFGFLPSQEELSVWQSVLAEHAALPEGFLEKQILRGSSKNLMNKLMQDILTLYEYDDNADALDNETRLYQGIALISKQPTLICYNYASKQHALHGHSLYIHPMAKDRSTAENILRMLRSDGKYTKEEAQILDLMLALHSDHGGGNNSTFVNVVMGSTGTDLYAAFAGAIGALKGPKHGGANCKAAQMMKELMRKTGLDASEAELKEAAAQLLRKEGFDQSGLLYGFGHAIYTYSDPRAELLQDQAKALAIAKGKQKEFAYYERFAKCVKALLKEEKGITVCTNVDYYSGFVYELLQIPEELYTPLFACARSMGWLAHNIEHQLASGKIVRPATRYVGTLKHVK